MRHLLLSTASLLLSLNLLTAQDAMFERITVPVVQNGQTLPYPFAGGLNAPQFSAADLNNDGVEDLVVFDRAGNALLTFVNDWSGGVGAYRFAPNYARTFPKMRNYVLLRDYNGDGAADIFCNALGGNDQEIQVFRGYFEQNVLKFTPVTFTYPNCAFCNTNYIYYPDDIVGNWNNFSVSSTDIPAFDDVDNDGDLDIVAFTAGSSTYLTWLKNISVEEGWGRDSLYFVEEDRCWGKFYENGLESCRATLSPTPDACAVPFGGPVVDDRETQAHPGATVLTYDRDNDGDREVLLGNISFNCLSLITNGGSPAHAWMTAQDTLFPSEDQTVNLSSFPAAYYLDVDGDGVRDLLVSPNSPTLGEDRQNVHLYKNVSSDDTVRFELTSRRLFVGGMLDFGTASHPAFADVNGDGLTDLVVGMYGYYQAQTQNDPASYTNARLYLFENTGSFSQPKFTLTDNDWLEMSQFTPNDYDFAPAFGDLDSDGDLDLLVGSNLGALYAFFNTATPGNPMNLVQNFNTLWTSLDVGSASTPLIHDLDGDGRNDILMGERTGNVNFFKNTGTASVPNFNPQITQAPNIANLGAINTQTTPNGIGFSAPQLVPAPGGGLMLVSGTQDGHLEAYRLEGATSTAYTTLFSTWGNIDEGARSCPAMADLDGDGVLEMVVGNQRGGLSLYRTTLQAYSPPVDTDEPLAAAVNLEVQPNPANEWTNVLIKNGLGRLAQWQVYDLLGRSMADGATRDGAFQLPVHNWAAGVYVVTVNVAGQQTRTRLVVR